MDNDNNIVHGTPPNDNDTAQHAQHAETVKRFTVSMPIHLYNKLAELLAINGNLEYGAVSSWVREMAQLTINETSSRERFAEFVTLHGLKPAWDSFNQSDKDLL